MFLHQPQLILMGKIGLMTFSIPSATINAFKLIS